MVNDFRVRTNYKTNSICSPLMRPEVYNHRSPLLCCGWLVWGKAPPPMCGLDKIRHTPQLTSPPGRLVRLLQESKKNENLKIVSSTSYSEPSKYFIAGRFSKSEKKVYYNNFWERWLQSELSRQPTTLVFKRASRSVFTGKKIKRSLKSQKLQVSSKLTIVCLRVLPMLQANSKSNFFFQIVLHMHLRPPTFTIEIDESPNPRVDGRLSGGTLTQKKEKV